MSMDFALNIVKSFEQGKISRRQLVAQLVGVGGALATMHGVASAGVANPGSALPGLQDPPRAGEGQSRGVAGQDVAEDQDDPAQVEPTFRASGLHHIALDVTDVPRSRDFYIRHLGMEFIRGGDASAFLGRDGDFCLALFGREQANFNHYSYAIPNYDAADAVERLTAAGLEPRRSGNRVYFPDPDGHVVQVSQEYAE